MSKQRICDGCGEPIDETQPFYTASVQYQSTGEGPVTADGAPTELDWHVDHLPQPIPIATPYSS